MKTLRLALATAVVAAFAVLTPSTAQADHYGVVTVTVTDDILIGGGTATVTATVNPSSINCQWEVTYLDQTETGSGNSITASFDTRVVDQIESDPVVATCTYDDGHVAEVMGGGGVGSFGASLATVEREASDTGTITLLPRGGDDDDDDDDDDGDGGDGDGDDGGLLPNTGGERLLWLLIGGMLVVVGGGVIMSSRRRDA